MTHASLNVPENERSDSFAKFFENKIKTITENVQVDPLVYNGSRKMNAENCMFMTRDDVKKCIESIKVKNCEGYDTIPQRILVDGIDTLLDPLSKLFKCIYYERKIPEQWR